MRDHPTQVNQVQMDTSQRDRFFQGLKKTYRDSLRYLYDTGASYLTILTAARKAEHYKETEAASAKGAQAVAPEVMEELAAIKAMANKGWSSQQKQAKAGQGDSQKGDWKPKGQSQKKRPGACYGCGGTRNIIRDCPNPHKKSLNFMGGARARRLPLPRRRTLQLPQRKAGTKKTILPHRMGQNRIRASSCHPYQ